jgi:hypothetical protein
MEELRFGMMMKEMSFSNGERAGMMRRNNSGDD